jgi:CubicO group peptidase (beta-lactamase class C family)
MVCLVLSVLAIVPQAHAQSSDGLAAYVDSVVKAAITAHKTVGASVAVVKGGRTLLAKGYGLADMENDVPATDETVYRIGSITKQFTAAAIMRFVEQGKISLDDTLQKFFPTYDTKGNRVTIRHLLTHTSGIASYTGLKQWAPLMRLDLSTDSLIAVFAKEPFDFKPGDAWKYDNSGYFLLGTIIAKISGKTYDDYMNDQFLPSVGLTHTRYCSLSPIIKHRAQGYSVTPLGIYSNARPLSMTQPYAAGALCSTVTDLATWARALSSGKVVSAASYTQMSTAGTLNNGKAHTYGFGLGIGALSGHREISHNGGINGFISELHHFPDDSLIVVVLTNTEGNAAPTLEKLIAKKALGIPIPVIKNLSVPSADSARFAGEYVLPGGLAIRIFASNGAFRAQATGQGAFLLRYQGNGLFVAEFDDEVTHQFAPGNPSPNFVLDQGGPRIAVRKP